MIAISIVVLMNNLSIRHILEFPHNASVTQSTIAQLGKLIPTLEAAFKEAGIAEKESWAIKSAIVLDRLELEIEVVRQEYILSSAQVSPVAVAT